MDPGRLSIGDGRRWESLRCGHRKRVEWAASRALMQYLGVDKMDNFSLSHAASHAAVAVAPTSFRIGVDIEAVRPRDVRRLAALCFARDEVNATVASSWFDELCDFYIRWTLKEAFAKALGQPLATCLRECCFWPRADGWSGRLPATVPWNAVVYEARRGVFLAAAVIGNGARHQDVWVRQEWPPERRADWRLIARVSPC